MNLGEQCSMKIKQQKQIKAFLIEEFGKDKGSVLFDKQEKILDTLIRNTKNKSKDQMKTLVQTILPRIALYKYNGSVSISSKNNRSFEQRT